MSPHLYIDGTFITTKEYYQLLVIMYYDKSSNKKIPGFYILINNKYTSGYIKALEAFKRLISLANSKNFKIKSVTRDFEEALLNAINAKKNNRMHVSLC